MVLGLLGSTGKRGRIAFLSSWWVSLATALPWDGLEFKLRTSDSLFRILLKAPMSGGILYWTMSFSLMVLEMPAPLAVKFIV